MSIWFKKLIEKYTGKKEEVKVETPSTPQPQSFHVEKHKPQKAKKTKKKKVSHPELLDMSKIELDIWARQRDIRIDKSMSKEDIIKFILSTLENKEN